MESKEWIAALELQASDIGSIYLMWMSWEVSTKVKDHAPEEGKLMGNDDFPVEVNIVDLPKAKGSGGLPPNFFEL